MIIEPNLNFLQVKKTTEAFNNYFNSSSNSSSSHNSSSHNNPRWQDKDSQKMPPPKFAPIKKRKSKRTIDFGLSRSAPTTPVGKPPAAAAIPEVNEERGSDSDSEFGFGNSWSNAWLTFCSLFFSLFHCLLNLNLPFQKCHFLKCPFRFYVYAFKLIFF